jgi:transcriptional regulator with XRE-family HTH domain
MKSAVKQRLVQFIKSMHMTQRAFEIRCGMSNGYVANIRKGIGEDYLLNIAQQFPQLNRAWLLFGEGEMLKTSTTFSGDITIGDVRNSNLSHIGHGNTYINDTGNNDDATYIEVEEVERAPILSATLARAPQVDVLEAVSEKADELEKAPVGVFNAPVSVWYRVQDESLAPKYEVGDLLALWAYPKGEEDPIPGKMYGINTSTNGLIVRRLFPQEDGGYIAKAANREEFPDYRIKPGNVVQIYKIMLMVRF